MSAAAETNSGKKKLYGVWMVQCKHCFSKHGPVGNPSNQKDLMLNRYYCPRAQRTVFLTDVGEYFGECMGTPTNSLKNGFANAIWMSQVRKQQEIENRKKEQMANAIRRQQTSSGAEFWKP